MSPPSSIPPTPQKDAGSLVPYKSILPSPDATNDVPTASSNPAKDDMPSLPNSTQEISEYLKRLSQIPDVRQDRIVQIQEALNAQAYDVSAEDLADSLIQDLSPHPHKT